MIEVTEIASLLFFALAAGFVGALFGIGGGVVIVPVLTAFFGVGIKEAAAVSIVSVVATSIAGGSRYVEQGMTNVRLAMFLEMTTTLGALTGAFLTLIAPRFALFFILSMLLAYLSIIQIKTRKEEAEKVKFNKFSSVKEDSISKGLNLAAEYYDVAEGKEVRYKVCKSIQGLFASYIAGILSGLLGIGGGVLKVSIMNQVMNIPTKVAIATSKFMIGVTASTSALLYLTSGLIDYIVVTPIAIGVMIGATIGTILMNRIKVAKLKALFGLLLSYFSYLMLARGLFIIFSLKLPGV